MPRLLLVRHGDTEYNDDKRFMGYSDIALSNAGVTQIRRLHDYLAREKIEAVYASDLKRTLTTAEIIAAGRHLEVIPCPELREIDYGLCEGLTLGEISRTYPHVAEQCTDFTPELAFPGGENFQDFAKRVAGFLKRVKTLNDSDTALVISHNGPLKVLLCHFLGLSLKHWWQIRIDTASLSIVDIRPRGAVLTRLNDVSFLKHNSSCS